jgi:pimeloyl-ACP methyl ester carboxylesterase
MKRILAGLTALLLIAATGIFAWGYAPDRDPEEMRAKYANAASRFVDLGDGLSVHVRDEGNPDGRVLVLLHGSNASLHTWDPWVKRLGRRYRIIRYDQIGHGLTGPAPDGRYNSAAFVRVLDRLMTKMGVLRFALAGNSMGGGIAWNYALAYPEKLTALVLVDAGGAPEAKPRALPIGFRIAQTPGINRVAQIITPRSMVEKSLRQSVSRDEIIDPAMIDRYWELLLYPGNREATGRRFATPRIPADPAKLATLRVPTLIIWGEEDALIPVSAGTWLAKSIPGSRLIIYPGIGHIPMEEDPDRSAADVDAFLTDRASVSGATG